MTQPHYEPIDITIPGCADDPRNEVPAPEGVVVHRGPPLHPDDVTTVRGIPVTSPARTLVDLAEILPCDELREAFARARELGLLDMAAVAASAGRVEWRPSLPMLREVMDEFSE